MLTGARSPASLDLARQLSTAGHTIFVADTSPWHICRFSNAVKKTFVVPSPRFKPELFIEMLLQLIALEKIDIVIPNCEEILTIAKYKERFPKSCEVFCSSFDTIHDLHNKWTFINKIENFGFPVPKTYLIENSEQINDVKFSHSFALKPCYSRASARSQQVVVGEPVLPFSIESHNPFVAQEWLEGKKFCSYSICKNGVVQAHTSYPVEYAIDDRSCVSFRHSPHEAIHEWVCKFARLENFTGQIGFDFIETENNLYAIECNPRATHGVLLFRKKDRIDTAFFKNGLNTIFPDPEFKKQIALGMLMYGWKSSKAKENKKNFVKQLLTSYDVVFDRKDVKPFLTMPMIFFRYIWCSWKLGISIPAAFTYDLDWNGEELYFEAEPAEIAEFASQ